MTSTQVLPPTVDRPGYVRGFRAWVGTPIALSCNDPSTGGGYPYNAELVARRELTKDSQPVDQTDQQSAARHQRVVGAFLGSIVGDSLGAPFESGEPGEYSKHFPTPVRGRSSEMTGGRGWEPGEWTDDTQMALLVADALLRSKGLDEATMYHRFRIWLAAGPADVGIQTRAVLSNPEWRTAASEHARSGNQAAGNGSLMRTVPAAIWFSRFGTEATVDAARRISALTHGDPAAGEGCAIHHRMMAAALDGHDPLSVLDAALADVPEAYRAQWAENLDPAWTPAQAKQTNGAVWPTLGTAVWALRHFDSFEAAMTAIIDIGGDTDTVACVAGGLLGATWGIQSIPSRWTNAVHGEVPGYPGPTRSLDDLQALALSLDGEFANFGRPALGDGLGPQEVLPGLFVADLTGATRAPADATVISLCRSYGYLDLIPERRQIYLTDDDYNLDAALVLTDVLDTIDALQADGSPVLLHCMGGASRVGLVLRGWLVRHRGLTPQAATAEATALWPHVATWNPSFDAALAEFAATSAAAAVS
jgi:ADP-ribosyl-[dinitrogen reductase] hydrolase